MDSVGFICIRLYACMYMYTCLYAYVYITIRSSHEFEESEGGTGGVGTGRGRCRNDGSAAFMYEILKKFQLKDKTVRYDYSIVNL